MSRRPAATPEGAVLSACLALLKLRGFPAYRMNTGGLRTPAGGFIKFGFVGCPDIIGLVPGGSGRFLGIEVKAAGKARNTSAAQDAFLGVVRQHNGVALVVDDVATLDAALSRLAADPWASIEDGEG